MLHFQVGLGIALRGSDLAIHRDPIVAQERQQVAQDLEAGWLDLARSRSLEHLPRFLGAPEEEVADGQIDMGSREVGVDGQRSRGRGDRLFVVAGAFVGEARGQGRRDDVAGIHFAPRLERALRRLEVAGDLSLVGRGDEEPLAVGGAIAQAIGFAGALGAQLGLAEDAVAETQPGMGQGEPGVDLDRALVEWHGGVPSLEVHRGAEGLERLERRRAGFFERAIVLLDGGQRFADPGSEGAGGAAQGSEHVLLARRLHLLLGQDVAAAAVLGAQSHHVLRAEAGNRALEHRAAADTFADLAGHLSR